MTMSVLLLIYFTSHDKKKKLCSIADVDNYINK